jgi:hypothetical protein
MRVRGMQKNQGRSAHIPDEVTTEGPEFSSLLYRCQMGHQDLKKSQLTRQRIVGYHFVGEGHFVGKRDRQSGGSADDGGHPYYPLVVVFGYDWMRLT